MIPIIGEFRDNFSFLSNFHPAKIIYTEGLEHYEFPSSEHYFQAFKHYGTPLFEELRRHPFKGLKAKARSQLCRTDWDQVKERVMLSALFLKFTQNPDLKSKLLATKGSILIEGTWWHDNYWGDCMCQNRTGKHPECLQPGLNRLGFLLMYVREQLHLNTLS